MAVIQCMYHLKFVAQLHSTHNGAFQASVYAPAAREGTKCLFHLSAFGVEIARNTVKTINPHQHETIEGNIEFDSFYSGANDQQGQGTFSMHGFELSALDFDWQPMVGLHTDLPSVFT